MSEVLPLPDYVRVSFDTINSIEAAIDLLSADPVVDVVLLPKAHLLWEHNGYALQLPNRANERVMGLLKKHRIPFVFVEAS